MLVKYIHLITILLDTSGGGGSRPSNAGNDGPWHMPLPVTTTTNSFLQVIATIQPLVEGNWQAIAGECKQWQPVAGDGRLWQALAGNGRQCSPMARRGEEGRAKAINGRRSQAVAGEGQLNQEIPVTKTKIPGNTINIVIRFDSISNY